MLAKRESCSFSHELLPHEVNTGVFLFAQTELQGTKMLFFHRFFFFSIAHWLKLIRIKEERSEEADLRVVG